MQTTNAPHQLVQNLLSLPKKAILNNLKKKVEKN